MAPGLARMGRTHVTLPARRDDWPGAGRGGVSPGTGGPRSRDPGAVGAARVPAGTASCHQGPKTCLVHVCPRRLL